MRVGKTRRDSEERRSAQEKTGLRIAPTAHLLPRDGEKPCYVPHLKIEMWATQLFVESQTWSTRHLRWGWMPSAWGAHGVVAKGPRLKPKFHQAAFRGLKAPAPSGKAKRKHGDNRRLGSELSQVRKSGPGAPSCGSFILMGTWATRLEHSVIGANKPYAVSLLDFDLYRVTMRQWDL